ncbi:hypothetical protein E3U55_14230 [Filobacillus milosensis]|uniref:Yip1 domain-containing protein n=1 Tax=Filobacillus milosensis TaxID=94137 RepID=A0A4Y8IHN6_9BACI|nr:hypothetical protein [Filobacillus milosensis]TFB14203.1 hypothetical protein E3U55_14230 [Filobacillus milosensis]
MSKLNNYIYRLFTDLDGQLYRIEKAEYISTWKMNVSLFLATIAIYIWMAWLGMGSNPISSTLHATTPGVFNAFKLWFIAGRGLFAIIFAGIILFLVSYIFYLFTSIPYRKLVIMQQVVLVVLLFERLLWIPLFVFLGLNWYVSPFSLGVLASYVTDFELVIYFFGAISILQIWIMFFQVKYMYRLQTLALDKRNIWWIVIAWHIFTYILVATLSYYDEELLFGWFKS